MTDVKNAFVQSPGIVKIINTIESKIGSGHRRCPNHLKVIGESGSGKTTFIEHLITRYPRTITDNDDQDIVPYVHLKLTKDVSNLALIRSVLEQLGDPDYKEPDVNEAYKKLWSLLEKCQVELICFDEFHNMRRGLTSRVSVSALTFIKDLSNNSKALLVAFGTEETEELISTEKELATRFDSVCYMPSYSIYDGQRCIFEKYLLDLSKYVDISNAEHLFTSDFPERLYFATRALPRTMARLIDNALKHAKNENREVVNNKDYYQAALGLSSARRQAKVFFLSKIKVAELVSMEAYKKPECERSLEILQDIFSNDRGLVRLCTE